jgi:hypothetical protein
MQLGSAVQPARAGLVLISLIAVAAGRQPEPASREFRAALDRPGIRFLADDSGFDRGRLLAAVGCIGPLSWRAWRSLRARADAHLGMAPSVPACLLAAFAPSDGCCSLLGYSEGFPRAWLIRQRWLWLQRCGPGPDATPGGYLRRERRRPPASVAAAARA